MTDASTYLALLDPERDPKDSMERALSIMRIQLECFQNIARMTAETPWGEDPDTDQMLMNARNSQMEMNTALLKMIETVEWLYADVFGYTEEAARGLLPDVIECIVSVHETMQTISDLTED